MGGGAGASASAVGVGGRGKKDSTIFFATLQQLSTYTKVGRPKPALNAFTKPRYQSPVESSKTGRAVWPSVTL